MGETVSTGSGMSVVGYKADEAATFSPNGDMVAMTQALSILTGR